MIFQPIGGSGSGGGLTAETGEFATRFSGETVSLGFKAKACIVAYGESADNVGFLVAGGSTNISAESGNYVANISLSSESNNAIRYLALG